MNVQTFINNVDAEYPNVFSDAQKIAWLNRAVTEIYPYAGVDSSTTITSVADQSEYDLTVDFEHIHHIDLQTATGSYTRYTPKTWGERLDGHNYFRTTDGHISFYPKPETSGLIFTVYYRKNPSDYSDMDTTIELREDGLIAANDYVISMMCRANDDIEKGNNFRADYNSKLRELKLLKYKQAGKYPTTKDVNKRSGMNRRRDRMGTSLFNDIVPRG